MTAVQPGTRNQRPIVVYRSVNRNGATYSLERGSIARILKRLGDKVHARDRLFLTHEDEVDYTAVRASITGQIIMLLTGLPAERLSSIGSVSFRDPVTDQELPRA